METYDNEMEKMLKMIKVGAITAGLAFGTFVGCVIFDEHVDHLNELCPFGLDHQVKVINQEHYDEGIRAYKVENGETTLRSKTSFYKIDEDSYGITAPAGYTLSGDIASKNVKFSDVEEGIVITEEGEGYMPDPIRGENRLITGYSIPSWDPQIVRVLSKNK